MSENGLVQSANHANTSSGKDAGEASRDSLVDHSNGLVAEKLKETKVVYVDLVDQQSLGDVECQGIEAGLRNGRAGATNLAAGSSVPAQVEEVGGHQWQGQVGQGPQREGRPEAGSEQDEEIGQLDWESRQVDGRHSWGSCHVCKWDDVEEQECSFNQDDDCGDGLKGAQVCADSVGVLLHT